MSDVTIPQDSGIAVGAPEKATYGMLEGRTIIKMKKSKDFIPEKYGRLSLDKNANSGGSGYGNIRVRDEGEGEKAQTVGKWHGGGKGLASPLLAIDWEGLLGRKFTHDNQILRVCNVPHKGRGCYIAAHADTTDTDFDPCKVRQGEVFSIHTMRYIKDNLAPLQLCSSEDASAFTLRRTMLTACTESCECQPGDMHPVCRLTQMSTDTDSPVPADAAKVALQALNQLQTSTYMQALAAPNETQVIESIGKVDDAWSQLSAMLKEGLDTSDLDDRIQSTQAEIQSLNEQITNLQEQRETKATTLATLEAGRQKQGVRQLVLQCLSPGNKRQRTGEELN